LAFVKALVPILDNIDYALNALENTDDSIKQPIVMLQQSYLKVLEEYLVARILPQEGDPFDTEIHQAISVQYHDVEREVVGQVARIGYTIGDQVFRPADVVIYMPRIKKDPKKDE